MRIISGEDLVGRDDRAADAYPVGGAVSAAPTSNLPPRVVCAAIRAPADCSPNYDHTLPPPTALAPPDPRRQRRAAGRRGPRWLALRPGAMRSRCQDKTAQLGW